MTDYPDYAYTSVSTDGVSYSQYNVRARGWSGNITNDTWEYVYSDLPDDGMVYTLVRADITMYDMYDMYTALKLNDDYIGFKTGSGSVTYDMGGYGPIRVSYGDTLYLYNWFDGDAEDYVDYRTVFYVEPE